MRVVQIIDTRQLSRPRDLGDLLWQEHVGALEEYAEIFNAEAEGRQLTPGIDNRQLFEELRAAMQHFILKGRINKNGRAIDIGNALIQTDIDSHSLGSHIREVWLGPSKYLMSRLRGQMHGQGIELVHTRAPVQLMPGP